MEVDNGIREWRAKHGLKIANAGEAKKFLVEE